jgi:hypothetical protein
LKKKLKAVRRIIQKSKMSTATSSLNTPNALSDATVQTGYVQIIEKLKPTAIGEAVFYWRVGAPIFRAMLAAEGITDSSDAVESTDATNSDNSTDLPELENKALREVLLKLKMRSNSWARKIFEAFLGWWIFETVVFPTYRRNFRQASNAILMATIYGVDTFSTQYTPAELRQLVHDAADADAERKNKRWNYREDPITIRGKVCN